MNGEIQQASWLVISAREALYKNCGIDFTPNKNVLSVQFSFAPRSWFGTSVKAKSVEEWFRICVKRGLQDIKFIVPSGRKNKHLLGFANTSQCVIVCLWKNGKTSHFFPFWEFDTENEGWKILYTERYVNENRFEKLRFFDKTDEFRDILIKIGQFAADLEFSYFADTFRSAYETLNGGENGAQDSLPVQLPDGFKAIYAAVEKADVFGAMGSWNDSPPCYAAQKGMEEEYEALSNELLVQLRYHLMYVTNECWMRGL